MLQKTIVIIILAATVVFIVRWIIRTVQGKNNGCSCGCGNCHMNGTKNCTHCPSQRD